MTKIVHGTVHGKTIELDEDLGVAEGQAVEVQVKLVEPTNKWGEGIRRSAGGWVLLIGAARYAFLVAGWALPWMREPLPSLLGGSPRPPVGGRSHPKHRR